MFFLIIKLRKDSQLYFYTSALLSLSITIKTCWDIVIIFLVSDDEEDDDDGLPNEYDYNDSFIDDEDFEDSAHIDRTGI